VISGIGHFLGSAFSLKNLVPETLSVLGGVVGTAIAPGVGTAIGAGLGDYAGNEIEGRTGSQSLYGGLEAGALAGVGSALAPAAESALSGTVVGNALDNAGSYLASTELGQGVSAIGSDLSSFGTSLGSDFGLGSGAGADVGAGASDATGTAASVGSNSGTLLGNAVNSVGGDVGLAGSGGGTLIGNAINSGWSALTGPAVSGATAPTTAQLIEHTGAGLVAPAAGATVDPALTAAASTGASSGGLLSGGSLLKDAVMAAPVALAALRGNEQPKFESNVQGTAAALDAQGTALANYLQTGTLPPGAQASINQAAAAATAAVRSQYASMGDSGSSAEAQDIANVQERAVVQATDLATRLLQTGISEQQASASMYGDLMNQSLQQDADLSSAIGNFAAAAAGFTPTFGANDNNGRTSLNVAL
jgi:hypothetical protein